MRSMPGRAVGLAATLMLVVAACGSASPSGTMGQETAAPTATPIPEDPTSEELIADALTSGTIGYEDSLLYRALALYDSPGLPDQYRSKVPDMHAAGELLREIDQKESTLSPGLLEELAPYRVRPADPTSIYNTTPEVTRAPGAAAALAPAGLAPVAAAAPTAAASAWKSKPAAGGKVRVWVKNTPSADAQLTAYAAAMGKIWDAYPGIFTYPRADRANVPSTAVNPDSGIDIYFVDVGALDPRREECAKNPSLDDCRFSRSNDGYAQITEPYVSPRSSSGYMVINAAGSGDNLIDTLAHELAHVAQFNYDDEEVSWLYESTATWTAYKVMKKLGLTPQYAYDRATGFYRGLDQPLTRETRSNAYGAWLYFLFASMDKGNGIVVDVWTAAGEDGVDGANAVDKVLPFNDNFARFSVRDWNQDPVSPKYDSVDETFPDLQPSERNRVTAIAGGQDDSLDAGLPAVASAYFDYSFEDTARAVTFENSLAGVPNAHVWAIAQIKDKWQPPQDWSGLDKKKFCRDAPEEDVTRLILIVSNSSLTDKLSAPQRPRIEGDAEGCVGWAGTMTGTYWWSSGGVSGTSTSTFGGMWVVDESDQYNGCYPEDCLRFIPEGTINWTWDATGYIGQQKCQQTTSGSLPASDPFGLGDQQFLHLTRIDDGHYRYWGQGNFYLSQGVQGTITCFGFIGDGPNPYPPPFFSIDEAASSSNSDGGGNTCFASDWVIETKATTISGSCYTFKTDRNYHEIEWSLTRLGPPQGS